MFKPEAHLARIINALTTLGGDVVSTTSAPSSWKTRVSWGDVPTEKTRVEFTPPTTVGAIALQLGLVQPWSYRDLEPVFAVVLYCNSYTAQNGEDGNGIVLASLIGKRMLPHLATGGQVMVVRDGVMYQDHDAPKTALSWGLHG